MQRGGPWEARETPSASTSQVNVTYGNLDRGQTRRGAPLHRGATLRQQSQTTQQSHPDGNNNYGASSSVSGEVLPTSMRRGTTRRNPNLPPPIGAGTNYTAANYANATANRALTRGKTLTRPDRHVAPAPLINPQTTAAGQAAALSSPASTWFHPWSWYVVLASILIPSALLSACGIKGHRVQRAWREKWALCTICLVLGGLIGFFTIGLNSTLCPDSGDANIFTIRLASDPGTLLVPTSPDL